MSLATKYRPTTFEEVCGQNITTTILKRVVENKSFKNCYIFSGTSGCGKTTCARIFANLINEGIGEPIEVDAASNSGVDNVRSMVDSANQRSLTGEYKVFIIDECHSLTSQAWQAFLKGIEECPKYTIFIFCTTEPQKLPATILNRMQRYTFAPISSTDIQARLEYICQAEGFVNYTDTCSFISKIANGGMRNAISYLEQCADFSTDLSLDNAKQVLRGLSYESAFRLTWAIRDGSEANIISLLDSLVNEGQDLKHFIDWYLEFVLNLIKYVLFQDVSITIIPAYLATPENDVLQYTVSMDNCLNRLNYLVDSLLEIKSLIKYDSNYVSTVQVMLLKVARTFSSI